MFKFIFIYSVVLFSTHVSFGQAEAIIANSEVTKPKIILVMLHLSTNKIEGMKIRGMDADIPAVVEGDEEINISIMNDFATNFKFCPVYFFYDTCYDQIKNKQWSEVTFYDYESLTNKKKVKTGSFSDYYFVEVGYRAANEHLELNDGNINKKVDQYGGVEESVSNRNYGINLYNQDFNLIKSSIGFTDISLRGRGQLFGPKKFEFEGAAKFEKKLRKKFD